MKRILVASVTNRGLEVVQPHLESILALETPPDVEISLAYISDNAPEDVVRFLHEAGARVAAADPKPEGSDVAVSEVTHHWNLPAFSWLAFEKQKLLNLAVEEGFDAIFLVDSDLVLGPETLTSLLAAEKPIVSAVFWTAWQPDAPALPQVWLSHPYDFKGRSGSVFLEPHEFLERLTRRSLVEVGGLGACTLIRTAVLDRVAFHPLLEGLPAGGMWQGEDRSFCIRASRARIPLWADAWPDIHHAYRPSDTKRYEEALEGFPARRSLARWGDEISAILEPLEEPELVKMGYRLPLRGRVGQLRLLPEIEEALLSTPVGEDRILRVAFPLWWSVEGLRGVTKSIRLRVLDVKERPS